jgi:hypothetical protein
MIASAVWEGSAVIFNSSGVIGCQSSRPDNRGEGNRKIPANATKESSARSMLVRNMEDDLTDVVNLF